MHQVLPRSTHSTRRLSMPRLLVTLPRLASQAPERSVPPEPRSTNRDPRRDPVTVRRPDQIGPPFKGDKRGAQRRVRGINLSKPLPQPDSGPTTPTVPGSSTGPVIPLHRSCLALPSPLKGGPILRVLGAYKRCKPIAPGTVVNA